MTKTMLKNLITKSTGYDEEDTKLMYEGIVEERKERELLEERKRRDNLEPSSSEYASPIVLVKKNGDSRLCVDCRQLNRKHVKDRFPLPIIDYVLDRLQEAKVYTTLDLKNGFFHVDLNEDCRKFTSFIVPDGQFEFNKRMKEEGLRKLRTVFEVASKYGLKIQFKKCQFLKRNPEEIESVAARAQGQDSYRLFCVPENYGNEIFGHTYRKMVNAS
ncbi:hypothetical protein TNIN_364601 [Trichonephila inaurata madagascariensis]|uniref:Reverse transcriptase domain-containing protein n=1 Tax=Trichonephila inaurata madagascariensis TaxID=2747483 RepID=A0A8X6XSP6_9ARAC|nr:hypothetical protein TNIN_478111 [Trichonephila inaurata madagascariensis]GFY67635.1 hypothetical protein TNIN_364601 [Trichonephila inaurata madagascariensis]